jgi:hypothetical protein
VLLGLLLGASNCMYYAAPKLDVLYRVRKYVKFVSRARWLFLLERLGG